MHKWLKTLPKKILIYNGNLPIFWSGWHFSQKLVETQSARKTCFVALIHSKFNFAFSCSEKQNYSK